MKIEIDTDNLTEEQKRVLGLCAEKLSPAEEEGWKVGHYGVVTHTDAFTEGSIVRLHKDDGTIIPEFELVAGSCRYNSIEDGDTLRPGCYEQLAYIRLIGKGVGRYER